LPITLKYLSQHLYSRVDKRMPLTDRELDGLKHERNIHQATGDNDLNQYLTFCNPLWNEHAWKVERGKGRDMEFKFPNGKVAQIEGKYSNSDYYYEKSWYYNCVIPRFTDPDATHIVVSNKPENLTKPQGASSILGSNNITVTTISELIPLLLQLLHTIPQPLLTNLYRPYHTTIDIDSRIVSNNPVIALLQEARRIKLWEESLLEHGIDPYNS